MCKMITSFGIYGFGMVFVTHFGWKGNNNKKWFNRISRLRFDLYARFSVEGFIEIPRIIVIIPPLDSFTLWWSSTQKLPFNSFRASFVVSAASSPKRITMRCDLRAPPLGSSRMMLYNFWSVIMLGCEDRSVEMKKAHRQTLRSSKLWTPLDLRSYDRQERGWWLRVLIFPRVREK